MSRKTEYSTLGFVGGHTGRVGALRDPLAFRSRTVNRYGVDGPWRKKGHSRNGLADKTRVNVIVQSHR
jgi:hypothetical protein